MKKNKVIFMVFIAFLLITGCTTQKPLYYWGNYSKLLYKYNKKPSVESRTAFKNQLLNIIIESKKEKLNVPPGVYAEYGYILYLEGMNDPAISAFNKEKEVYPESSAYVDMVMEQLKLK